MARRRRSQQEDFFDRMRQDTAEDAWTKGPEEVIDGNILSQDIKILLKQQAKVLKGGKRGEWYWSLRLREVRIKGALNLADLEFPFALALEACRIEGNIDLSRSAIQGSLNLRDTEAEKLVAEDLTVRCNVLLERSRFRGGADLRRSTVEGRLLAQGAVLENLGGYAFCLDGGTVKSDVRLNHGFHCLGGATLQRAKIQGDLDARGAIFEVPATVADHQDALRCDCAEVHGDVLIHYSRWKEINYPFLALGSVRLVRTQVHGSVLGYGAELESRGQKAGKGKPALDAEEATVNGSFLLKSYERENEATDLRVQCRGMVRLRRAHIGGRVSCSGAKMEGRGRSALVADEVQVGANLDLKFGFEALGGAFFEGAEIAGNLDCRGGRFEVEESGASERNALDFHDAEIGGDVLLKDNWDGAGQVRLSGCNGPWLRFESLGCVNLFRAQIGGSLECHGATFRARGFKNGKPKPCLNAEEARISGSALLRCFEFPSPQDDGQTGSPVHCWGTVLFYRATIGRRLVLGGAQLIADAGGCKKESRKGVALRAQEIEVAQSVELQCTVHGGRYYSFRAFGEVNLDRADINGSVDCGGGQFLADGKMDNQERHPRDQDSFRPALSVRDATIGGSLWLTRPMIVVGEKEEAPAFRAEGRVTLPRTKVTGAISFENATLNRCPAAFQQQEGSGNPLSVRLDDTQIEGVLSFRHVTFDAIKPLRISANAMDVQSTCWLSFQKVTAESSYELELRGACFAKFLLHPENSWPREGHLHINGLRYGVIQLWEDHEDELQVQGMGKKEAKEARRKRHQRFKEWLELQPREDKKKINILARKSDSSLSGQPYEQLIKALRQEGDREGAREIAIAKRRLEAGDLPTWIRWAHKLFLGKLIDYGYRPWKVLPLMLGIWLFGVLVFGLADRYGFMKPTDGTVVVAQHQSTKRDMPPSILGQQEVPASYPRFNPWAFSADTFLPIIDLHQATYWLPQETPLFSGAILFAYYLWLHTALGWILATIAIAGLSGIIKTE